MDDENSSNSAVAQAGWNKLSVVWIDRVDHNESNGILRKSQSISPDQSTGVGNSIFFFFYFLQMLEMKQKNCSIVFLVDNLE